MASAKTDTVAVACKMQHGLRLDLFEKIGEDVNTKAPITRRIEGPTVKGVAFPRDPKAIELGLIPTLHGGYAITPIERSHWERWWDEVGKHTSMARDGLIFAADDFAHARAQAAEQAKVEPQHAPLRVDGSDPRLADVRNVEKLTA